MLNEFFGAIFGCAKSAAIKFRRQRPIGPYFVDFVCLEKHIVVEVDGGQLRFWDHEVLGEIENVKQVIWQALNAPSSILPRNEGEED
jgi:very-short-patch-repair endonuclease